ncbi:MAG: hypothetical protein RIT14_818 [Pseudomonadota bacterium]|jgi:pyrroline-5-carboxylate reductase
MRLGFVGSGAITAAMVEGLSGGPLRDWPIVLSPRNAAVAADLAARFGQVRVAADNQAVVDGADMVFVAVRPQVAEAVLAGLRFRPGQSIVSLVAALSVARVAELTGGLSPVVRAIPLPFVAARTCVTPIHPADAAVAAIFDDLGGTIAVEHIAEFDAYGVTSALMATYFGLVDTAAGWAAQQGLPRAAAERYLRNLFGNLGDVLRRHPDLPLPVLREEHSTRGGLNEMAHLRFEAEGGAAALRAAMAAVKARIDAAAQG